MISSMPALRLFTKKTLRGGARFVVPLLAFLFFAQSAQAIVYMKPKEVLGQFFRNSEKVVSVKKPLNAEQKKQYDRDEVVFYVGKTGDKIDGYALMDHQIGKTQPITFMTLIGPDGKVKQIEVLVYRESHGMEVRHQRFLKQFYEKGSQDPLRRDRDIINISGATLSVNAMIIGVKRALALWEYFFGQSH